MSIINTYAHIRYFLLFNVLFCWIMPQVHDDSRLFVLEIGTEELPPQDVVDASQQVQLI